MTLKQIGLAAVMTAFATGAMAADPVFEEPAPLPPEQVFAPVYDWTGLYVGIQGGYAWTRLTEPDGFEEDFDGGALGAHAGFNFQHGDFVYGIEGDFNYNWNENTYFPGGVPVDVGVDWDGSVRARLGYAWDRTLIYGTGGVAFANGYIEAPGFDESESFVGWTIGAGVEHAFLDNVSARLEYRYSDFGSEDFGLGFGDFDLDQHTVRVGLSYRF